MSTKLMERFLTQFVSSDGVRSAEPLLTKLAGRLLALQKAPAAPAAYLSRDAFVIKREMLEAVRRSAWAEVSLLAAELDLGESPSTHSTESTLR